MSRNQDIEKLRELTKDITFCMLSTRDSAGRIHSRPMTMQQTEFDGDLWFLTGKSTGKTGEIARDQQVNVSFADPGSSKYVSVSGSANVVDDRAKAKELWNPAYMVWFPKGLDDPELTLLHVSIEAAEYWDSPNGVVTYLMGFIKAATTGERPDKIGDHEKLELSR